MADSSPTQSSTEASPPAIPPTMSEIVIPPSLKFLMNNLKLIISNQLTSENYSIWRLQIFQLFSANGYEGHLTGDSAKPTASSNELWLWNLIDQNLISALLSTISPAVLPYILNLSTARDIWITLELRLQPTNRSRVIQLKNEFYHIQMKDLTMMQYLAKIKSLVDNIAAAGSILDPEEIILHILNGLPPSYNSFKTSIRTSQLPLSLDVLYNLLCSEEIHMQTDIHRNSSSLADSTALYTSRGGSSRGRSPYRGSRGRGAPFRPNSSSTRNDSSRPTCQICNKSGHIASSCWHRFTANYGTTSNTPQTALLTISHHTSSNEWVLIQVHQHTSLQISITCNIRLPTTALKQSPQQMAALYPFITLVRVFYLFPIPTVSFSYEIYSMFLCYLTI
ncbi:uncharacterized protein LOC110115705 [Dendrobium catenatum]|uniref:uncharacterized protein LOC110115705 n=1 Tax=Dendrobium catenatum TaxID=906689 RepID=UPI0009F71856|nr:uncharacterized protein LOC110115705 [Dendrobium catenatum]